MLVVAVIVVVVAATAVATCLALPRTIGKVAGVDFLTANPARALQHNLCGHVQLFMSCCHTHPHPLGHASSLSLQPRGKLFKTTSCSSSVTYLHKALHKQPYPPRDSSCWCSTMCNNSHRPETPLPLPALLSTLLPVSPLLTILKLVWVQSLASHTASTPQCSYTSLSSWSCCICWNSNAAALVYFKFLKLH